MFSSGPGFFSNPNERKGRFWKRSILEDYMSEKAVDPRQSVFRAAATRDHGRSPARTEISTSDDKSFLEEFGTVETRMPGLGRC